MIEIKQCCQTESTAVEKLGEERATRKLANALISLRLSLEV